VSAEASPGRVGDLAIVLHSHMPYVEGFGTYPFGEEWLFDAVIRSYAPLSEIAERLTMTVTPVLADQLEAPGVADRLTTFLREFRIGSCEADVADVDEELRPAVEAEAERYRRAADRIAELHGDLLALFSRPAAEGRVELWASSATHAVLPLVATEAGQRLQIDAGLRSHVRRFGEPAGFWLPECAYDAGLERLLAERDLGCFCVDQSDHEDPLAALAPVATDAGPVALAIDWEAVQWLWSLQGYPSDPAHADFHRKSMRGARPWSIAGAAYDPRAARERAREQGREFCAAAAARLERFRSENGREGVIVFAIDTELLGHWWWEGPDWLAEVIGRAGEHGVELVTASDALERHESQERPLRRSSWGEGKDLRTWDSPPVADFAWAARRLELRLLRALGSGLEPAVAERAARELLAVQASDWAFLDQRRQAGDYPFQRHSDHAMALLEAIGGEGGEIQPRLRNLAPDLSLAPLLAP
jgi:1,4-alpha-glucan branching enzyme